HAVGDRSVEHGVGGPRLDADQLGRLEQGGLEEGLRPAELGVGGGAALRLVGDEGEGGEADERRDRQHVDRTHRGPSPRRGARHRDERAAGRSTAEAPSSRMARTVLSSSLAEKGFASSGRTAYSEKPDMYKMRADGWSGAKASARTGPSIWGILTSV